MNAPIQDMGLSHGFGALGSLSLAHLFHGLGAVSGTGFSLGTLLSGEMGGSWVEQAGSLVRLRAWGLRAANLRDRDCLEVTPRKVEGTSGSFRDDRLEVSVWVEASRPPDRTTGRAEGGRFRRASFCRGVPTSTFGNRGRVVFFLFMLYSFLVQVHSS